MSGWTHGWPADLPLEPYPIPWSLTNSVAVLPPFSALGSDDPVRLPVGGRRVVCPRLYDAVPGYGALAAAVELGISRAELERVAS